MNKYTIDGAGSVLTLCWLFMHHVTRIFGLLFDILLFVSYLTIYVDGGHCKFFARALQLVPIVPTRISHGGVSFLVHRLRTHLPDL